MVTACAAIEEHEGVKIYRQRCASCHGANGEGTPEDYPHPLIGDRSLAQLTRLIARTMPADEPGTCVGPEAEKVASYIHDAFYSKTAQARNAPARIELARLTVRQYRNVVADLVDGFRGNRQSPGGQGLRAEYFRSRQFRDRDRVIERVDPEVRFDFQDASPDPDKMDPRNFSIRWNGSVLAPETGEYEFVVRTEHSTRLWINDGKKPLVDAWVRSGDEIEHRGTIFLLGGRAYGLRLEFSKSKQGVDDSNKKKQPPPAPASIRLEWRPPRRALEVIPRHCLNTGDTRELFVSRTPFPPDDRSMGYVRGTSVSKAWDQATTDAAIETANYVVSHLDELAGDRPESSDRGSRLREFCGRFAACAFRRPLSDEQKLRYIDRQFEKSADVETAVRRVVLLTLKSPRFLFRELGGEQPDSFDAAARLALTLWDSIPDQPLWDAATSGRLSDPGELGRQAERMLSDRRTHSKLRDFLFQWLKVDQVPDLAKDPKHYPGFDVILASDLRTSLELFIEDVVWSESSDFRRLLLADDLFLNGRLSRYYGAEVSGSEDTPFQKVALDPGVRAGIVTHPYLLATFAYTSTSSPIHRGVFLARGVLGRALRPPPEAAAPLPPELHPDLTTRQRVALQTKPAACNTCHGLINPLGFPLEQFDAVGRFRSEEMGKSIDASGSYQTRDGSVASFEGARQLAGFLAESDETHDAFVQQIFQNLVQQPIRAYGPKTWDDLRQTFAESGYNIQKLTARIAVAAAVSPRRHQP